MFEVAICDDSTLDIDLLKRRINRFEKYKDKLRFHVYHSGIRLLAEMKNVKFSIIFMDIQMEGMDGEQTAEEIRKSDDSVVLVFYTGYAEPSLHSIEVQPYRFIKKNMSEEDKNRYIEESLDRMVTIAEIPTVMVKVGGNSIVLKAEDIVYVEKYKKVLRVHLLQAAMEKYQIVQKTGQKADIRIADKLDNLYQRLKPYGFGYPHDSYMINFKYLVSCKENEIRLEEYSDMVFRVTRSKAPEFNHLKREFLMSKYKRERE